MRYHWVGDRVRQGQFDIYWREGGHNLADYSPKITPSLTTKLCAISLSHPNALMYIIRNIRNIYIMFLLILCMRGGCVITNLYNIHNALLVNTHYKLLCPLDQDNLINNNLCKYLLLILVINSKSIFWG